jgi:CspA family cold shock protein
MNTGTVMWFNNQKGFGFIQPDNGNKDVFVHITAVEGAGMYELREGQKVFFDLSLTAGPASLPRKICKPPNGNASPDAAHQSP